MVVDYVILVTLILIILVVLLWLSSFLGFVGVVFKVDGRLVTFCFVVLIMLEVSFWCALE